MALSLKISNIVGNELELIQRLKKVNSPGKKALLIALKNSNYSAIYKELLFRIELYAENKVLNYTRQDLNTIVTSLRKVGIDVITNELVKKYVPVAQQQFIEPTPEIIVPETYNEQQFIENQEVGDNSDIVKIKDYIEQNSEFYIGQVDEDEQELMASHIIEDGERYVDEARNLLDKIMEMFPTFIGKVSTRGRYVSLNIVIDGPDLILNESVGDYKAYFLGKLQDFGVESPADLSTEEKTKFFNEISDEWESQSLNESEQNDYQKLRIDIIIDILKKSKELNTKITQKNFSTIIAIIEDQLLDEGKDVMYLDKNERKDLLENFSDLNATDTIIEVIGKKLTKFEFEDGESLVEKIYTEVEDFFEQLFKKLKVVDKKLNESENKEKTPKDYYSKKLSISSKTFENNCKEAKDIAENMDLFDKETSDKILNKVIIKLKNDYNDDEEVTNAIISYIQDLYYKASNLNESENKDSLDESTITKAQLSKIREKHDSGKTLTNEEHKLLATYGSKLPKKGKGSNLNESESFLNLDESFDNLFESENDEYQKDFNKLFDKFKKLGFKYADLKIDDIIYVLKKGKNNSDFGFSIKDSKNEPIWNYDFDINHNPKLWVNACVEEIRKNAEKKDLNESEDFLNLDESFDNLFESENKEKTPKDYFTKKLSEFLSFKQFENNCKSMKIMVENMNLFDKGTSDKILNKAIDKIKNLYDDEDNKNLISKSIINYINDLYKLNSNLNESEDFLNLDENFDNLFESENSDKEKTMTKWLDKNEKLVKRKDSKVTSADLQSFLSFFIKKNKITDYKKISVDDFFEYYNDNLNESEDFLNLDESFNNLFEAKKINVIPFDFIEKSLLKKKVLFATDDDFATNAVITEIIDLDWKYNISFQYSDSKTIVKQDFLPEEIETLIKKKKVSVKDDISPDMITITLK